MYELIVPATLLAIAVAIVLAWTIGRGRRRDRTLVRLLDLADELEALLDRSQDRMVALQAVVGRVPADIAAVVDQARQSDRQNVLLFIYREGRQQAVAVSLTETRSGGTVD